MKIGDLTSDPDSSGLAEIVEINGKYVTIKFFSRRFGKVITKTYTKRQIWWRELYESITQFIGGMEP